MDLVKYRQREAERQRTDDLMALVPEGGGRALDIGAREGHFSKLFTQRFAVVTALDLQKPEIDHPRVDCVKGDVTDLPYKDDYFDFVFCAEVLEHIPPALLSKACSELGRVCRGHLLIGVPYRQDIRIGRTTCSSCGAKNPPWGHVNEFDEGALERLFTGLSVEKTSYVGVNDQVTNPLSTALMDWAGNPYGTYEQDEPCLHCGSKLTGPKERSFQQKVATRFAVYAQGVTKALSSPHANWIHRLFRKESDVMLGAAAE